MNIALITYPVEKSPAGVGIYVQNLVQNIIEIDRENHYYLLHYTPNDDFIYRKNEILYRHYKYLPVMFSDSWYLYNNSHRFDIAHRFSPGGFLFRMKCKTVVTVHDLFFYKVYPFNKNLKLYLARYFNRSSLKKADVILADSNFTKQEILKTFHLDEGKIHVVYSASDMIPGKSEGAKQELMSTYGIKGDYILFVSTIEPRKNLLNLVKAYELLKDRYSIKESLVVVGKKGWDYGETLNYIENSKFRESIILTGYVPSTHLAYFYGSASLFVYPSFMEGFGIPPLEAMQCGCAVLTSNTSSLPEVVGDQGMMFDPFDVNEIVDKCLAILKDRVSRRDNIRKGMKNVNRFSWRKRCVHPLHV